MSDTKRVAATRASTLAKALDDSAGLMPYYAATTLQAIVSSPTLRTALGLVEFDGVEDWRPFKPLVAQAQAQRGKPEADAGTNIHAVVQAIHEGREVFVADEVRRDAQAALAALEARGLVLEGSEEFVVAQGLGELVAGTRDARARLVAAPDAPQVVVDFKSTSALGAARYRQVGWAIQVACYAHGVPYLPGEPDRDRWGRPLVDLDSLGAGPPMNIEHGAIVELNTLTQGASPDSGVLVALTGGGQRRNRFTGVEFVR